MRTNSFSRIVLSAVAFVALFSTADAQTIHAGFKGGLSFGWLPGTVINGDETVHPHNNFYAGGEINCVFGNGFFAEMDITYCGKGHSDRGSINGKYSRTLGYIQIPLMFGAEMIEDKLFLSAGPELGFLVRDKITADYTVITSSTPNKFNIAAALQVSYFISDEFGVNLKADYGLNRTFSGKYGTLEDKAHNLGFQLGICYLFEL